MEKILGIDLGTNSIGWAIRDTSEDYNQIVDKGVLRFDKGVGEEKGREFPLVKKRTEARSKRRNYQAEKYRKWELLECLIKNKMCPLSIEELNEWRKYKKGEKRKYPKSQKFIEWLRFDFNGDGKPDFELFGLDKHESYYVFRAMAVSKIPEIKKVFDQKPFILGRIFYQLVQRRGFKGRDTEEAKTMLEGSKENKTLGRNEISDLIERHETLGAALYHLQKEKNIRIRKRYNLRSDYENELKKICELYNIDGELYKQLWKSIIWQRPLRSQKGLVGKCIFETNKKRCHISHPLYEEYRTWVFINNLKISPPSGVNYTDYIEKVIYPLFLKSSNDFKIEVILKQLHKDNAKIKSKFKPNTKLVSARLLKSFQDILGNNWREKYYWDKMFLVDSKPPKKKGNFYTIEDIWHVLQTFDSKEKLFEFAQKQLNLDDSKAEKFSKIKLNQGYTTLSLSALKKILQYLKKGFLYSNAVYLANLHKVFGTKDVDDQFINLFSDEIDGLIKSTDLEKNINSVVNSLIRDFINDKNRYSIDNYRNLDDSEKFVVKKRIEDIFGQKSWSKKTDEEKISITSTVEKHFREFLLKPIYDKKDLFRKNKRLHDVIFEYLQESYGVPIENKRFLWHPSEQENYHPAKEYYQYNVGAKSCLVAENNRLGFDEKNPNAQFVGISLKLLGSPEPVSKGLKNPMALKTLHKLKHLINYLLKTGKIEEDTRIVVEIARELNDSNRRKAIERWQRQREKENEEFAKIVIEILKPKYPDLNENNPQVINKIRLWFEQIENGDEELKQVIALKNDVKKWRLWNEQKCQCLYTGYPISIADLFNGNKFDIEHTIPASISFDNELKNLTIADSDFNRNIKKNKIPTQLQNYPDIESRLRIFKEKVDHYKELVNDWLVRTRYAKDKESKDRCIQNRHFYQFELEYWRKKLETFTCEEYKQGWRNSQLRDTQIITKYALPYLKTVFKKVEVQKGSVVNDFKEIYSIKFTSEKKNREKHHHHAIDAAILTLIPPFAIRDKILLKFNKAKEQKKTYHELPYKWNRFTPSKILNIENDVLINYMPEYRSVNNTYKKVRKRGKVQYVREKNADGSFRFKKDEYGNKIPIMAKGDTIRGQLHKESFYGAIRKAKRDEDGRIIFDSNNNMVLDELPTIVKRRVLEYKKNEDSEGFKSLDEIEKVIIDRPLFEIIKKQIQEASSFKDAMEIGVWMLDKKGEKVNKIRRIRCGEKVKFESVIKVHKHTNESDKSYKKYIYAMNGENALCLFYEDNINGKIIRSARLISLYEMAQLKITNEQELFDIPLYKKVEVGRGKNKVSIPLTHIFKSGDKVIFYKNCIEELKDLDKSDQLKRLYILYGFEDEWDKKRLNKTKHRISFRNHLIAGTLTDIKKMYGQSSIIDFDNINPLLRLSKNNWNFAIEGKNFDIEIDGTINWRD